MTKTTILLFLLSPVFILAQNADAEFEKEYQKRIKKSRIGDTYIPKDYDDAFIELKRLSPPQQLKKFKSQPEAEVAKKLHFGLGKWMMVNWSFYEGSRYSHILKEKGISYPDDMAQITIRLFHRHLNNSPLNEEMLLKEYIDRRTKEHEEQLKQQEVIDSFRRKKE